MSIDLTNGPVTKKMMLFSLPLIAGNLLQQTYNIADTVIVGRFLGADALAAVGSSYALMTFLTSILLGLCMGSGALFPSGMGKRMKKTKREYRRFISDDCCSGNIAEWTGLPEHRMDSGVFTGAAAGI